MGDERDDSPSYQVLVNDDQDYSIWPADREPNPGWTSTGYRGTKAQCLAYLHEKWTAHRPLDIR